jgi:hypothetical protein
MGGLADLSITRPVLGPVTWWKTARSLKFVLIRLNFPHSYDFDQMVCYLAGLRLSAAMGKIHDPPN